jgi:hypothetical protein
MLTTEVKSGTENGAIGVDELQELKDLVSEIRTEISDDVQANRQTHENTRFCLWDGQSPDGRKRAATLGRKPLPFEGASDTQLRLADKIINKHTRELVTAATRVVPKVVGMEGTDDGFAGRMGTLIRWLVRSQWGAEYRRQVELMAQYAEGDTPGAAVAMVDWVKEIALEIRTVTQEDVILLAAKFGAGPEDAADLADIVRNPARLEELKGLLKMLAPSMTNKTLTKAAEELQAGMETTFPAPYLKVNMPMFRALRLYEDIFIPANTTDIQKTRVAFLRHWYSEVELRGKVATDGWSKTFVDKLVGHEYGEKNPGQGYESQSAFQDTLAGQDAKFGQTSELDRRKGLFEVLTAFQPSVNEDGVPGIYMRVFSSFVDEPAKDRELFARKHGKMPFVWFSREYLTSRIMDSRGVAQLVATQQSSLKMLHDSFEDSTQVTINPPIKKPQGKAQYQLTIEPFGQLELGRNEDVKYMEIPTYPAAAGEHETRVRREVAEYFGIPMGKEIDPALVLSCMQDRVDRFLWSLSDVFKMTLQLCQENMPDEMIQRIMGAKVDVQRGRQEIQGQFDLFLSFDVRDLDMETFARKCELMLKYARPMDVRNTVPWDRMVARILQAVDPNWADEMIPPEEADAKEIADQKNNLAKIFTGIRPDRPDRGLNFPLRMSVTEQELNERSQNPQAYPALSPASAALLQEELDWLKFQSQQMENATIGRKGYTETDLKRLQAGPPIEEGGA